MKLEGVAIKYSNFRIRLGSTDPYINIYDAKGRYAGDIKLFLADGKLAITVFHPAEEPRYSAHHFQPKGNEEFAAQRHENFKFFDFDWTDEAVKQGGQRE